MKRITDRMEAFDQGWVDGLQETYLWIYDRTGILVGTVLALMEVAMQVIRLVAGEEFSFWSATSVIVTAAVCGVLIRAQRNSALMLNASTMAWRGHGARLMLLGFMIGITLADTIFGQTAGGLVDILVMMKIQLMAIGVRDREPPKRRRDVSLLAPARLS